MRIESSGRGTHTSATVSTLVVPDIVFGRQLVRQQPLRLAGFRQVPAKDGSRHAHLLFPTTGNVWWTQRPVSRRFKGNDHVGLTRKLGEKVVIDNTITVTVVEIKGNRVPRLAFDARNRYASFGGNSPIGRRRQTPATGAFLASVNPRDCLRPIPLPGQAGDVCDGWCSSASWLSLPEGSAFGGG